MEFLSQGNLVVQQHIQCVSYLIVWVDLTYHTAVGFVLVLSAILVTYHYEYMS